MYEVIVYFEDLQDGGHPYNVGDAYPRKGLEVSEARIRELISSNNARRKPLICVAKDEPNPAPVEEPKAEPVEEPVEEAEKPKKGTKNGRSNSVKSVKSRLGKTK